MIEKNSAPKPPEIPRLSDEDIQRIVRAMIAAIWWNVVYAAITYAIGRWLGWWP